MTESLVSRLTFKRFIRPTRLFNTSQVSIFLIATKKYKLGDRVGVNKVHVSFFLYGCWRRLTKTGAGQCMRVDTWALRSPLLVWENPSFYQFSLKLGCHTADHEDNRQFCWDWTEGQATHRTSQSACFRQNMKHRPRSGRPDCVLLFRIPPPPLPRL